MKSRDRGRDVIRAMLGDGLMSPSSSSSWLLIRCTILITSDNWLSSCWLPCQYEMYWVRAWNSVEHHRVGWLFFPRPWSENDESVLWLAPIVLVFLHELVRISCPRLVLGDDWWVRALLNHRAGWIFVRCGLILDCSSDVGVPNWGVLPVRDGLSDMDWVRDWTSSFWLTLFFSPVVWEWWVWS